MVGAIDEEGPGAGAAAGKYPVTVMEAMVGLTSMGVDTGWI